MPGLKTSLRVRTLNFQAIGTDWHINLAAADPGGQVSRLIYDLIRTFDQRYSRFRKDSWVTSISAAQGRFIVPDDAEPLLNFYRRLYDISDGRVTPLIGNMMSDAGYDAAYSLLPQDLRPVPKWEVALAYDHPLLDTFVPFMFDFGAAGKGYLIDLIGDALRQNGVERFVINAGGDMFASHAERVALERPDAIDEAVGIASIDGQAICGSAGNRRKWANYTHIIDPLTGISPVGIQATWVVAESAMVADGLATALFFCEPSLLQSNFKFEYAAIMNDGSLYASAAFPANFFTTNETTHKDTHD